ncbi:unnamed protein product [Moneuplotes crassus]|uniref:Uncharacterized protein n=1 Tax=Euplotes crassus TaxID=5936 RepID=A0AAD1XS63_EUPCR|nr:unnamed protein product [Moneuplotes crassus]
MEDTQVSTDDQTFGCKHYKRKHNIEAVKCLECEHVQKPDQTCENCGIEFAKYFCPKCNLFDEEGETVGLFHCDDCGICRQGGRENAYHCKECDICMYLSMKDLHQCANYRDTQCPICFENFYGVRDGSCRLECGHVLHSECYDEYFKNSISCPICKKFPYPDSIKELIYSSIEQQIEDTAMGEELSNRKDDIICNDCNQYSSASFNIIALKCLHCGGYNTSRVKS